MRESMKIIITKKKKRQIMQTILGHMKQFEYVIKETTDSYEQIVEDMHSMKPDMIIADI